MKIKVNESGGKGFTLALPTRMLFSPKLLKFAIRTGRKHADKDVPDIPPEAVEALCAEVKRIKKKYGTWTLVDIESADGDLVQVIL